MEKLFGNQKVGMIKTDTIDAHGAAQRKDDWRPISVDIINNERWAYFMSRMG